MNTTTAGNLLPQISEEVQKRFWAKVNKEGPIPLHYPELGPCWVWFACKDQDGYGIFQVITRRTVKAHRACWFITNGQLEKGVWVLHHCDNASCVNPEHLFLGTHADNIADMVKKGRAARGEKHSAFKHPEKIVRGERQGNAKLTEGKVRRMRFLHSQGFTLGYLAEEFGVSDSAVWFVVKHKSWRHVTDEAVP